MKARLRALGRRNDGFPLCGNGGFTLHGNGGFTLRGTGGFTLIEMSVVVAIIGVLYFTVVPLYGTTIQRTKETALKQDLHVMRKTLDAYYRDTQEWPRRLEELVTSGYLRAVPEDPITKKKDSWIFLPSEPGLDDIFDIKSGASGDSLDGIPFGEF